MFLKRAKLHNIKKLHFSSLKYFTFWSKSSAARALAIDALRIICAVEISFTQRSNFSCLAPGSPVAAKSWTEKKHKIIKIVKKTEKNLSTKIKKQSDFIISL